MLVIETIHLEYFNELESVMFLVGFLITSVYVILFRFSKQEPTEEDKHYYSRHNVPFKPNEEN